MTLEHYPGMTERALADVEADANRRWPLSASLIIHRHGRLVPGDDAPAMAKALGELMDDPALRASLGAGSRRGNLIGRENNSAAR